MQNIFYFHIFTFFSEFSNMILSDALQWVDNVRYLDVCVTRSTHFSCSLMTRSPFTGALMQSLAK